MWDWAVWGALAVGVVAGIGAAILLFMRIRRGLQTLKNARSRTAESLGDLTAKGELTAAKVEAAGDTAELHASVARLRVSLAQLAVLRAAIDDAEQAAGWISVLL